MFIKKQTPGNPTGGEMEGLEELANGEPSVGEKIQDSHFVPNGWSTEDFFRVKVVG